MINYVRTHTVTITIGVAFYVFGFFIAANLLHLSEREIGVGLISGAVGGTTMLCAAMIQDRRARMAARLA